MKHVKKIMLFFVMAVLFCVATTITAQAAAAPSCASTHTVTVYKQSSYYGVTYVQEVPSSYLYIKNLSAKATVSNIKSSNPAIQVEKRKGLNALSISANFKHSMSNPDSKKQFKPGQKSTITFTVKQNGKTYKLKSVITLKLRTASPFTTFKIGSKSYVSTLKYYNDITLVPTTASKKITVKTASGYTLEKINILYRTGKTKTVKNGATVSLKNATGIEVIYKVKKAPLNYKAPTKEYVSGMVPSPLHEVIFFTFNQNML